MKSVYSALLVVLAACGGGATPEARTVNVSPQDKRPAPLVEPTDAQKSAVEYVVVPLVFVEKYGPTPAADVKAWSDVRENRVAIKTEIRHILCKPLQKDASAMAEAKKKCEGLLARLAKGDDFAKVAEKSDDVGTANRGGRVGSDSTVFVEPFRKEAEALAPGETSKQVISSEFGWHIVRRDPANEDQIAAAYRKAKAPETTRKLADEILTRFKTTDSARAAIASAVESVLGDQAEADPARPNPMLVEPPRIDSLHLSPESTEKLKAFAKTAHAGQALDAPLAAPRGLLVARAWGPSPR